VDGNGNAENPKGAHLNNHERLWKNSHSYLSAFGKTQRNSLMVMSTFEGAHGNPLEIPKALMMWKAGVEGR